MNHKRTLLLMLALMIAAGFIANCFAVERVAKMSTTTAGVQFVGPMTTLSNAYTEKGTATPTFLDAHSFTVYTTAETDAQVTSLRSNYDAQIVSMKQDIKTLSDANDALTKRLNDLESQIKNRPAAQ